MIGILRVRRKARWVIWDERMSFVCYVLYSRALCPSLFYTPRCLLFLSPINGVLFLITQATPPLSLATFYTCSFVVGLIEVFPAFRNLNLSTGPSLHGARTQNGLANPKGKRPDGAEFNIVMEPKRSPSAT